MLSRFFKCKRFLLCKLNKNRGRFSTSSQFAQNTCFSPVFILLFPVLADYFSKNVFFEARAGGRLHTMTAGGYLDVFFIRLSFNKISVGHPERAQLAKLFAVEESHGVAPSGKKSSRLRRRDLRTVTNSFPRVKQLFRLNKRQRMTRVCATILRREIRPSFVGAPFGLREVVSLPHSG